ncbi:hypothetical protein [Sphingomonas sp. DT-204]|uniref:hypothetical protein n=1 Tax=Sphingomonas sp. DT-204 TaxID=3396166 RepID=UPI003F1C06B0
MSDLQTAKIWLISHVHLAKDALHIYVGLAVFFATLLVLRWRIGSWKPLIAVAVVALAGEVWDLRDSVVFRTRMDVWGNWHDIWNTLFWPAAITLLARWTSVFGKKFRG